LPAIAGDALEIDELVVRYRFKKRYRYLWVVVSRLTHQVLAWRVGDRSERTLRKMWFAVPSAYRRKLVYSDFYEAYATFFAPWQQRPSDKGSGKTSVIEGLNNKWRNRVAGLVRKTVCVQSLDDLNKRLWVVLEAHNRFCLKQMEKLVSTG
jgi:insertion element IS1 protein InsB